MGVVVSIVSQQYLKQWINGSSFGSDLTNYTNNLAGSVMQKFKLIQQIDVIWETTKLGGVEWDVSTAGVFFREDAGSFLADGFSTGDTALWYENTVYMANITVNSISPDGTQNAPSFVPSGTGVVSLGNFITLTNEYSFCVYLKGSVNGQKVRLSTNSTALTDFTLTTSWERFVFTFTGGTIGLEYYLLSGTFFSPAENNLFYIYGAQLEAGSYPTSYIPTIASTVTRNADVISKTGISSLIGQTEGAVFVDVNLNSRVTQTYFAISSSATAVTDYIGISFRASTIVFEVVKAGTLQATLSINPKLLTLVAVVALTTSISPAPLDGTTEYNLLAL